MPATWATGMATPVSSSPNNNRPTSDGTISNANPVAASPTAAKISTLFMAWRRPCLVFRAHDPVYVTESGYRFSACLAAPTADGATPALGDSATPASALSSGLKGSSLKVSLSIVPVNLNGTS